MYFSLLTNRPTILDSPIEYLKGVGPQKGDLLRKELNIHTFGDLLEHFPHRHIDKTRVFPISAIAFGMDTVQVRGILMEPEEVGEKKGRRLAAILKDQTGELELIWFQGIQWVKKMLVPGRQYVVYGKVNWFKNKPSITHPEIEPADEENIAGKNFLEPVYPTTEKLKTKFLTGRSIGKLTAALLPQVSPLDVPEFLPADILAEGKLMARYDAYRHIHFPPDQATYDAALRRLKFEELFLLQIKLNQVKIKRHRMSRGLVFDKVGDHFNTFYAKYLPFELTGAQKRVIKEIRADCGRGHQMNRLLQGDVGSGKTMVALLCMLLAADNGYQSCLMAPTGILAQQHYNGLTALIKDLPVRMGLLTG
ncbi:MAG TPA: DEAD/DEAH box helicase, partial [Phnomibacter sp.]|nr:DEAD/DEAH box helicase [Phnomibacter sp.]